jgi:hypothetical protein
MIGQMYVAARFDATCQAEPPAEGRIEETKPAAGLEQAAFLRRSSDLRTYGGVPVCAIRARGLTGSGVSRKFAVWKVSWPDLLSWKAHMKIQRNDLYHGAVLSQLAKHRSFEALKKLKKYGHYLVNNDRCLLVKLATANSGPWDFYFRSNDLNTLKSDFESGLETFAVLVCGKSTICLLNRVDFGAVIDIDSSDLQSIRVDIPGSRMEVRGSIGALPRKIAHNAFPDKVFAKRPKLRRERLP